MDSFLPSAACVDVPVDASCSYDVSFTLGAETPVASAPGTVEPPSVPSVPDSLMAGRLGIHDVHDGSHPTAM